MSTHPLRMAIGVLILACLGGAVYTWFFPADKEWRAVHDLPACAGAPTSSCLEERPGHFDYSSVSSHFVSDDGHRYNFHDIRKRRLRRDMREMDGEQVTGLFHDGDFVGFRDNTAVVGSHYWSSNGWIPPLKWIGATGGLLLLAFLLGVIGQLLANRDPTSRARFARAMGRAERWRRRPLR